MDTDSELKYNEDRDDLSIDQHSKPLIFSRTNSEQNWNQSMQMFEKKDEQRKKKEKNLLTKKEYNFFQKHFPIQGNKNGSKGIEFEPKLDLGLKKISFQKQGTFTNYQSHQEMPIVSTPTQKRRNFDFNNSFDDVSFMNNKIITNQRSDSNNILKDEDNINDATMNKKFLRTDSIFQYERNEKRNEIKSKKRLQYLPKNTGDTCYENLQQLYVCLLDLFSGNNPVQQILKLQDHEKKIFQAIIERKFSKQIDLNQSAYQIENELESIQNQESNKRPEENYKFVFKKCLKYMKEQVKKRMKPKRKSKKKDQEKFFYNYYFKEISEREQIPIEHFFHPKNSKAHKTYKSQNVPKTINMYYIENIKRSEEFVDDFKDYLDNKLIQDYQDQVRSKIESLIQKWNEKMNELATLEDGVQNIRDYILKNKKCKLPWSYKEITNAVDSVKSLFNQIQQLTYIYNLVNVIKFIINIKILKPRLKKKQLTIKFNINLLLYMTISFQIRSFYNTI